MYITPCSQQHHVTIMLLLALAGLLGLKTLVVKMCSVTLSMAGGLIAGKEGPFIHAGGIVGGGWASMGSRSKPSGCACQQCMMLFSLASMAVWLLVPHTVQDVVQSCIACCLVLSSELCPNLIALWHTNQLGTKRKASQRKLMYQARHLSLAWCMGIAVHVVQGTPQSPVHVVQGMSCHCMMQHCSSWAHSEGRNAV